MEQNQVERDYSKPVIQKGILSRAEHTRLSRFTGLVSKSLTKYVSIKRKFTFKVLRLSKAKINVPANLSEGYKNIDNDFDALSEKGSSVTNQIHLEFLTGPSNRENIEKLIISVNELEPKYTKLFDDMKSFEFELKQ